MEDQNIIDIILKYVKNKEITDIVYQEGITP